MFISDIETEGAKPATAGNAHKPVLAESTKLVARVGNHRGAFRDTTQSRTRMFDKQWNI